MDESMAHYAQHFIDNMLPHVPHEGQVPTSTDLPWRGLPSVVRQHTPQPTVEIGINELIGWILDAEIIVHEAHIVNLPQIDANDDDDDEEDYVPLPAYDPLVDGDPFSAEPLQWIPLDDEEEPPEEDAISITLSYLNSDDDE